MSSSKREDILAAALRLVPQYGFHGTSMAMIASEANSGAGTIYNYFSSKDELMKALFYEIKAEFVQKVMDGIAGDMPLQVCFDKMWRNTLAYYLTYPQNVAFSQQYHASPYFDEESIAFINKAMAPVILPFEKAMKQGLIKTFPLPVLVALTLDVAASLVQRHRLGEIQLDELLITQTGKACWQALQAG